MVDFALNHVAAPRLGIGALAARASTLGVRTLKRHIGDGTAPAVVREAVAGLRILSINALRPAAAADRCRRRRPARA